MLFKILHGDESRISTDVTPFHEGWAYVTNTGKYYVDMNIGTVDSPNNQRVQLNAANCETLCGLTLEELKAEIATQDAVVLAKAQAYTDAVISNIELPDLSGLETESRDIVGAINELNGKTVDKIDYIDTYSGGEAIGLETDGGITWGETFEITGEGIYREGEIYHRVPIVAGDNVTFEIDQGVVKINATGGSSESTTETDIFPLQTVSGFIEDATFGGAYVANSPISFVLTEGETYHVEWDGTTYTCECKSGTFSGMDILYLGNDTLLGGQSSEPFTIGYYVALGTVGFIAADNKTSHNIRIYQIVASGQPDWAQNDKAHPDYIKNRPFYESIDNQFELLALTEAAFVEGGATISISEENLEKWLDDWAIARVTWDGIIYECEPVFVEGLKAIGNIDALAGRDNGLPFIAACLVDDEDQGPILSIMVAPGYGGSGSNTYEVSISIITTNIKHLDTKFIKSLSWEKISDKPFDMTPAGTIVAQGTENFATPFDEAYAAIVNEIPLVNNTPYIVEFDGSTYNVTTVSAVTGTDVSIYYEDDGVLFAALNDLVPGSTVILALTAGNHTYKITVAEDIVKKIDPIYLPEGTGQTPVRGVDYWTEEDKAEIKAYVDDAILNGAW